MTWTGQIKSGKPQETTSEILPANADARDFAAKFFSFLGTDAKADEIKLEPNPLRIMPGGLERVTRRLYALREGWSVI
ncbi:hypothetical protein HAV15_012698 [Penicillium sp. str. |nr:hypothetical protein HAV15_012698 [Penicillium sp. str. \